MVETVILETVCIKDLKIENIPITQHYFDHQIQIVTNEAFIIEGHLGQVIGFTAFINISTPITSVIPPKLLLVTQKHHHIPGK